MYSLITRKLNPLVSPKVLRQLFFFAVVGGSGLLLDIGVLFSLIEVAGLNPELAKVFSTTCAIFYTWALNRTVTFRNDDAALFWQFLSYFKYMLFGMLINYSVFYFVNTKLYWIEYGYAIAAALGSLCAMAINFASMKYRIFKNGASN